MARTGPLLSSQIAIAFDAFDKGQESALGDLKSRLMAWLKGAQALESGQAVAEFEAEIAALKTQIANLEAVHKNELRELQSQNSELEALFEQATAEVQRLRGEQEKADKSQAADRSNEILRVLELLLAHKWLNTEEIQKRMGFRTSAKAEMLLKQMEALGQIAESHSPWLSDDGPRQGDWYLRDGGKRRLDDEGRL